MIDWVKRFVALAHNKATTYVALAIAGVSQVAEHAQEIVDTWPSIAQYVPEVPYLKSACHYVLSVLGVVVIFTRVRRMMQR